jgi:hypothetical protein
MCGRGCNARGWAKQITGGLVAAWAWALVNGKFSNEL